MPIGHGRLVGRVENAGISPCVPLCFGLNSLIFGLQLIQLEVFTCELKALECWTSPRRSLASLVNRDADRNAKMTTITSMHAVFNHQYALREYKADSYGMQCVIALAWHEARFFLGITRFFVSGSCNMINLDFLVSGSW